MPYFKTSGQMSFNEFRNNWAITVGNAGPSNLNGWKGVAWFKANPSVPFAQITGNFPSGQVDLQMFYGTDGPAPPAPPGPPPK